MRPRLAKCVPPWEVRSRAAYKRRKALSAAAQPARQPLQAFFGRCVKAFSEAHPELPGPPRLPENNVPMNAPPNQTPPTTATPAQLLEDINVRLQHLGYVGPQRRDRHLLIDFVQRVGPLLTDPGQVLRFLCSVSCVVNARCLATSPAASLKLSCHDTFETLFRRLDGSTNAYHALTCYLKLCAFYAQPVSSFSPAYHQMVDAVVSGATFVTERELDELLFVYQRLAVCDRRLLEYCSTRICNHFDCFSDDEVCNFARYLVKTVHARSRPDELGATADYAKAFSEAEAAALLDGFHIRSSAFVRCLEARLPVCLHQYSYFNLVDLGEFYYLFNLESDIRVRFSTELWKYLYTLRYGYPIKSLVVLANLPFVHRLQVLAKLGLGDSKTFGRLIRNIPHTLAFRWPLSLVAECLVSLEWAKNSRVYVTLAHYISKSLSARFSGRSVARIFDSLRHKRVALLGLYQKVLRIQSANASWLSRGHLLSVARYGKELGFSVAGALDLMTAQDLAVLDPRHAVTLLYLMERPDAALTRRCIASINGYSHSEPLEFGTLMELLTACRRLNLWLSVAPRLALQALTNIESIELPVLIELLDLLSAGGPLDNEELLRKIEGYVTRGLEGMPLRTTGRMLWLCFSLGTSPASDCFSALLRRFNRLYEPTYNEDHFLQVLGAVLKRLDEQSGAMRSFLRILEQFKDVSWRREPEELQKIRAFQNRVGCTALVSVFPFTADLEVSLSALRAYASRTGNRSFCESDSSAWLSSSASRDGEPTLLFDVCGNPWLRFVDIDGCERRRLRFYYQLRSAVVGRAFAHSFDVEWDDKRIPIVKSEQLCPQ
ncbi:uncharacterized protein BcabD6B2_20480 [Babesia caballi]|uniref:RAP domain-containing protein n=1 Tax=Babesia caballi TaxID=5871 RepID=A0AAV4LS56_BABCB|nr:hypothetical protein, conserved [Babesia caballi]